LFLLQAFPWGIVLCLVQFIPVLFGYPPFMPKLNLVLRGRGIGVPNDRMCEFPRIRFFPPVDNPCELPLYRLSYFRIPLFPLWLLVAPGTLPVIPPLYFSPGLRPACDRYPYNGTRPRSWAHHMPCVSNLFMGAFLFFFSPRSSTVGTPAQLRERYSGFDTFLLIFSWFLWHD